MCSLFTSGLVCTLFKFKTLHKIGSLILHTCIQPKRKPQLYMLCYTKPITKIKMFWITRCSVVGISNWSIIACRPQVFLKYSVAAIIFFTCSMLTGLYIIKMFGGPIWISCARCFHNRIYLIFSSSDWLPRWQWVF